jgi:hypothetical protein
MDKICLHCQGPILNYGKKFCSRSCAASYNNKKYPKRSGNKQIFTCETCGIDIPYRRRFCKEHNKNNKNWDNVMLKDLVNLRKYQKHSRVRNLARPQYLKNNPNPCCKNCGYSKHIEVCHIKPIKDFSETSTISEINHITNLIALCPNCHWEFDRGNLNL